MPKKFTTKYFAYLYKHKQLAPRTISKSIFITYNKIHPQDIYTKFIFFVFFNDTSKIECPPILRKLFQSEKIIEYIKRDLFEKRSYPVDIKKLPSYYKAQNNLKINMSQEEIYEILNFLLVIENHLHFLYLVDLSLIFSLVNNLSLENKIKILDRKYKISPILCILLETIQDESNIDILYRDIYIFLKSVSMEYREGFEFLSSKNLNFYKVEKVILYSKYKIIKEYHRILVNFYPEIIYNGKCNENRMDYFNNPLLIPLDYKILRSYLFCIPYYLKIINTKLNDPNFDILFRTIYFEKILSSGLTKKWCKLLHILILDNCNLVYVLLRRKFDLENVKMIVKYVPSFHLAFEHSIKFFRESGDIFYLRIIECLLEEYPVREYFKKISVMIEIFPKEFTIKFRKHFDEIEGDV